MSKLLYILRLPSYVYFILAFAFSGLAGFYYEYMTQDNKPFELALKQQQPTAVSLKDFSRGRDVHTAGEIHLIGLVSAKNSYMFVDRTRLPEDAVWYLFALIDPDDRLDSNSVRAAIILPGKEEGAATRWLRESTVVTADGKLSYEISGTMAEPSNLWTIAFETMEEKGLKRSGDFIFIDPFVHGRVAGLTPNNSDLYPFLKFFLYLCSALVLIGLAKIPFERKKTGKAKKR